MNTEVLQPTTNKPFAKGTLERMGMLLRYDAALYMRTFLFINAIVLSLAVLNSLTSLLTEQNDIQTLVEEHSIFAYHVFTSLFISLFCFYITQHKIHNKGVLRYIQLPATAAEKLIVIFVEFLLLSIYSYFLAQLASLLFYILIAPSYLFSHYEFWDFWSTSLVNVNVGEVYDNHVDGAGWLVFFSSLISIFLLILFAVSFRKFIYSLMALFGFVLLFSVVFVFSIVSLVEYLGQELFVQMWENGYSWIFYLINVLVLTLLITLSYIMIKRKQYKQ